ncbi:MAG: alanine--tRNA ligase [Deltaproteobacteria bacterium]|nr:alanine--tRNA ligase [Deltaproteobacteria bacterium]
MKTLTANEIRTMFLEFFRERGHTVVPSSGVVPRNDPTLLFTNAGMVQFKDAFLGLDKRPYTRAASSQKCVRMSGKHNDLENVGRTARHQTFFEMLGNFSFGDYFKREAITWAWELLTGPYGIPRERLMVTVFGGEDGLGPDDEARALWREVTGFGDERIVGLGRSDNFWSMGDTGPCGPCTEIHYWFGDGPADVSRLGQEPGPDGVGWVEVWNNVFMQYNRAVKDGPLAPLPSPCVDTGMGLERITTVLQGVRSNYDTDLLRPYVEHAAALCGRAYTATDGDYDVSLRVIADHARMAAFSLAEGILPSNKDRGAALRSVMRRAIRHGHKQCPGEPFFHKVVDLVCERMGVAWPELVQHRGFIVEETRKEDLRFRETIAQGMAVLDRFHQWALSPAGGRVLPGAVAWELNATYGFPLDLTEVIGQERAFTVDHEGYERAREVHAQVSRGSTIQGGVSNEARVRPEHHQARSLLGPEGTTFVGHDTEDAESEVLLLLKGAPEDHAWTFVDSLAEGDQGQVFTRSTPFYAEAGGQVGDVGVITTPQGSFAVEDTQKPGGGVIAHFGRVTRGELRRGEGARLTVDHEARSATRRNHSATHLLHWALRQVVGSHAQQKGSKVGPSTLRFDYASSGPLSSEEAARIEDLVNREVLENTEVRTVVTSQTEARSRGAMMIFEEKYGDTVRMLHIGSGSVELCGGTHARRTGDLGLFKIVSDAPVGAGVRRIEAVTGANALSWLRSQSATLQAAAALLKATPGEVPQRVEKALEAQKDLQRQLEALQRKVLEAGDGAAEVRLVGDVKVVARRVPVHENDALRQYADQLLRRLGDAVVVLGAVTPEAKAVLLCAVSPGLVGRFHAGKIVGELARVLGGRGGGKPELAQAGGPEVARLDEALARVSALVA